MSELDRLEALLAQATPAPWVSHWDTMRERREINGPDKKGVADDFFDHRDALLACEAVNALPALIACARALEETRDELEARVDCQGTEQIPCPDESGRPCWQCAPLTLIDQALARLAEGEPQP